MVKLKHKSESECGRRIDGGVLRVVPLYSHAKVLRSVEGAYTVTVPGRRFKLRGRPSRARYCIDKAYQVHHTLQALLIVSPERTISDVYL